MGIGRSKYTEEYKAAAVEQLYEPGASVGKVSKELGLTPTQLKMWRLEIEAAGSVEAKWHQQADATELTRLRKENKRLQEENEVLQKASDFFRLKGGETMSNKHLFIAAHAQDYVVSTLCRLLQVARSWFYGYQASEPARQPRARFKERRDQELLGLIQPRFGSAEAAMAPGGSIPNWLQQGKLSHSAALPGL